MRAERAKHVITSNPIEVTALSSDQVQLLKERNETLDRVNDTGNTLRVINNARHGGEGSEVSNVRRVCLVVPDLGEPVLFITIHRRETEQTRCITCIIEATLAPDRCKVTICERLIESFPLAHGRDHYTRKLGDGVLQREYETCAVFRLINDRVPVNDRVLNPLPNVVAELALLPCRGEPLLFLVPVIDQDIVRDRDVISVLENLLIQTPSASV